MRRQTLVGRVMPAGSSRDERLDPFTLPVRFSVADKAADGRVRHVELTRERVVVRRAVRGIKMAVNLPVAHYLGVALRLQPPEGNAPGTISIVLEHRDHALSLPLFSADDGTDIVAEWQSWARVLGMPLLVAEADGRLREAFDTHRRCSRRHPHLAASKAHGDQDAAAIHFSAAQARPFDRRRRRASRRARDHRAELIQPEAPCCVDRGSSRDLRPARAPARPRSARPRSPALPDRARPAEA